jgi:hypothetical protein
MKSGQLQSGCRFNLTNWFHHPLVVFLTALTSPGEESLWPGQNLMSHETAAFARFLLPKSCKPKAKAEPKRNIVLVRKNDFSSKFFQAVMINPPTGIALQGECQRAGL